MASHSLLHKLTICSRAEKVPEDATKPTETCAIGLCTGLFAAAAVSVTPSLSALVNIGAEFVMMAFRTGRHVASLGDKLYHSASGAESWTYIAPQMTLEEATALLDTFNESNVSEVILSIVGYTHANDHRHSLLLNRHMLAPRRLPA